MLRLLLDANLSPRVTAAVRRHSHECQITDLHEWEDGRYLEEDDALIVEVASSQGFTLVTRDIRTIPSVLARRRSTGLSHGGVVFVHPKQFPEGNVGAMVRALIAFCDREQRSDFRNREVYLVPASR